MSSTGKNTRPRFILKVVIIALLAMAAGSLTSMLLLQRQAEVDFQAATRFPEARAVQTFDLLDHNGAPFDNAALRQRWSFLFFGYTHCPDVCPTTLSLLNSVAQRLQDDATEVRFVFVTIDPERDTPEQLAKYVRYFNGDFVGVTGTNEGLEQLTRQLGIMYLRVDTGDTPGAYLMDHTASVFLFDPDGRYHAVFSPPLAAEAIVGDFRQMLQDYR